MPKDQKRQGKKSKTSKYKKGSNTAKAKLSRMLNKRNLTVVRGLITSDTKYVRLPLTVNFTQDPAAGGSSTTVISGNDLYVPTLTLGAYQPLGFDQHMAFYNHFVVVKSKIHLTAFSTGSTPNTNACVISCTVRADSLAITDWEEIQASRRQKKSYLNNSNSKSICNVSNGVNVNKWFGQNVNTDDSFMGNLTSSPAEGVWYHCTASPATPTQDLTTIYFIAKIVYTVLFKEPADLSESAA